VMEGFSESKTVRSRDQHAVKGEFLFSTVDDVTRKTLLW